jgi:hypothetical protein
MTLDTFLIIFGSMLSGAIVAYPIAYLHGRIEQAKGLGASPKQPLRRNSKIRRNTSLSSSINQ